MRKKMSQFDNYVWQWWVELDDELNWLFTNILSATRYIKVKRMGITEILRRIWLFSANQIKSSESFSKLNLSLRHIIFTQVVIYFIIYSDIIFVSSFDSVQFLFQKIIEKMGKLIKSSGHILAVKTIFKQLVILR